LQYPRHRSSQQRFRSRPGLFNLTDVEGFRIAACGKERAVQISLNRRRHTIAEHMNPLRQRLFNVFACRMIELAQSCVPGKDLNHSAASAFRLTSKCRNQHARCAHLHTATKILLK
jgi:hypothetical protein